MKTRSDFITKNTPEVTFPQPMMIQENEGENHYDTREGSGLTNRL